VAASPAAGGDRSRSLSIVSGAFPDACFLRRNVELTRRLNPTCESRWLVVDNTPEAGLRLPDAAGVEILPGVVRPPVRNPGSLHHALAMEKALRQVRTRFVLFLDHDFYVIRPEWIATVLAYVREREIGMFGSVWHPRWFYQYRDFPSVHFLLVDLGRVPAAELDLKPAIGGDRWWRIINRGRGWPAFLRDTLKAQRCRDTGWRLHRRFRHDPAVRAETLLPHYAPPRDARYRWERRLDAVLPSSWRKYPADRGSFTDASFLESRWPEAYRQGWEEFFWQGAPFGVHLRRFGRSMRNATLERDDALVEELMARVGDGSCP
jgi:hypothetical protein